MIRGDYVPQSFVDVDAESYLKTTIALYEFNEVGPLADLYAWESRGKSSKHGRSSASNHHCAEQREQCWTVFTAREPTLEQPCVPLKIRCHLQHPRNRLQRMSLKPSHPLARLSRQPRGVVIG